MTQDEIIKLAREAGIYHAFDSEGNWDGLTDVRLTYRHPLNPSDIAYGENRIVEILERFAALVAEATKEKAAKVCDDLYKHDRKGSGYDEGWNDALGTAEQAIKGMK